MLGGMVDTAARHSILVGVDGSPSALRAVEWAAKEAARRHVPVRLCHVGVLPPRTPHVTAPAPIHDVVTDQGRRWLQLAKVAVPGVEVETELRLGTPVADLVEASSHARMVVLGSHGLGGFEGMLAGSVSSGVAARAHCPVVVVRGRLPDEPPPMTGPVVVGVDGSAASDAAVAFAFEAASLRETSLIAVHTWLDVSVAEAWAALPYDVDWDAVAEDERRLLAERLAGWSEKYPDVPVRRVVLRDRPVRGLLAEAEGAQLIAVGSRGRGGFPGMGLGSTSQALLHYSECPVAVVR